MVVELTSPVLGQAVGSTYTGALEDWLLSSGYAKRAGYTGPGVANVGAASTTVANDPRLPGNRGDKAHFPFEGKAEPATLNATIANNTANLTATSFPNPDGVDFDPAGVDNDAPSGVSLLPVTGPTAGGTVITIKGKNLAGVTSVTFGGTAGTALDVSKAAAGEIKVTTPVGTAGAKNVVLVDPSGNATVTNGYTYA